jgi:hypothetical protein
MSTVVAACGPYGNIKGSCVNENNPCVKEDEKSDCGAGMKCCLDGLCTYKRGQVD